MRLSRNPIIDIKPIVGLDNLTSLSLGYNEQISDYSPLEELPKLNHIDFVKNATVNFQNYTNLKNIIYTAQGRKYVRTIIFDKVKHLGEVVLDNKFIDEYCEKLN